jgi:hypothetical protein
MQINEEKSALLRPESMEVKLSMILGLIMSKGSGLEPGVEWRTCLCSCQSSDPVKKPGDSTSPWDRGALGKRGKRAECLGQ